MFDKPVETLVDLLRKRAQEQADRRAFTFLTEEEEMQFTYAELDRKARALGAHLQKFGQVGDRALLLYQPGMDYLVAFFGCLYAGLLAVPAYPPRLNGSMDRLQAIVSDSEASIALTTSVILSKVEGRFSDAPGLGALAWVDTDCLSDELSAQWYLPKIDANTLAFLQYTSGSTSLPKGVMLTHGNLLHNLQLIHKSFATTPNSECVIWLPPYHDMGLIGGILSPLYTGFPVTLMSPFAFMQRPLLWLETISQKGATLSGGPNFAYDLCVQKITPEQKANLDLSTWKTAFTGAEPVRQETLDRFVEAFAECGFTRETFYPCYGLAEATLFVTGGHKKAVPIVQTFEGAALEEHRVVEGNIDEAGVRTLVGCGHVRTQHQQVIVVDPQMLLPMAEGHVGEIWVSGPSVAQGYWRRPEQTEETFRAHLATGEGPFLRTGDLGFMRAGELYITGRLKDLIIIRGRNYYPQDIEYSVQNCHVALRSGCGAAFSVDVAGEERLVIVQEVERTHRKANLDDVVMQIRQTVAEQQELQVYAVVLIKPASAPLTSSGKIQRHACREQFLTGTLDVMTRHVLNTSLEVAATVAVIESGQDDDLQGVVDLNRAALLVPDAVNEPGQGADLQGVAELDRTTLLTLATEKRQAILQSYLLTKAAQIVNMEPHRLDVQKPVTTYGLDSLMAVELKNVIEDRFEIVLPLVDFLDGPSVVQLATEVLKRLDVQGTERVDVESTVHFLGNDSAFSLSYGQRSLWFMQRLAPNSAAYNIAHAVKLNGELDLAALRGAFVELTKRHPVLRTTFTTQDDQPIQQVHECVELYFDREDAMLWNEEALSEKLAVAAHVPFDLEKGPLLRVNLFARVEQEHVLLLTIHHIIADFWSLGVMLRDLQALYASQKNGVMLHLAPLQASYADHVAWQAEMLEGAQGEQQWTYWQEQLSGELPVLNLPTDRPRPPVQTYAGATRSVKLGAELTRELKALAQEAGATLYTVLLAAFHVLLHRYTGQEDILVGSPTAGRSRAKYAELMGYFVNPVVLRVNVAGDVRFADFYEQVRKTVREALSHQEYPFALLVEKLQPKRDPSYSPIFQTMFVLQSMQAMGEGLAAFALNEAGTRLEGGELPLETMALEQRAAQYDLTLFMAEVGDELVASFEYNTDLFACSTMERMTAHFKTLLAGIVASPEARIAELPLLTQEEQQQMLVEWNRTEKAYAADKCFHQLIEEQVERTPDAIAVVFEDLSLTFRELNVRANRVAHYLVKQGIGAGMPVGICMNRSLDMMVGLLGILKAGGAYVPLDQTYPTDRLAFVMEDAHATVLLTQSHVQNVMPGQVQTICLDTAWDELAQESAENLTGRTSPEQIAYIIYTSGSTGKPKGVGVFHRSVVSLFGALDETIGCDTTDAWLAVTTIAFDIAVTELFWTLANGCKVVILSEQAILQAAVVSAQEGPSERDFSLAVQLMRHKATLFQCTPSLMKLLLVSPSVHHAMQGLSKILLAGEAVSVTLAEEIVQGLKVRLFDGYGPTETTVYATIHEVTEIGSTIPIGRPLANMETYILDAHLQPVPIGVTGELHIGGIGVSRGYLNRPELTAEKFIAHPFREQERLYKTGDLARYRADGLIEYLGRIDHQVKIRGFRIELGEIESAIAQQEAVKEVVVIARADARGDRSLVAYVVPEQVEAGKECKESKGLTNQIRQALQASLPSYMVPGAFVYLEAFPLTTNGKIDRKQLPAPEQGREELGDGYVAPRTSTEEILAGIWADVLQQEAVGVHDHFFERGGHSLLATQVISRVYSVFHVEVPLAKLFEFPTVEGLAACIEQMSQSDSLDMQPIQLCVREANTVPLGFAQERLWFIEQLQGNTSTYNMPGAYRLRGQVNVEALERGFNEILRRHEALRTTFANVNGEAVGVLHEVVTLPLTVVDLQHLPQSEREAVAARLIQLDAQKPFDLQELLIRTTLMKLGAEEHLLLLTIHHIVSDGWSMGVLVSELVALYKAFANGQGSPLPELVVQYADFAEWQKRWFQGEILERQLKYWKEKLVAPLPVLQVPTDHPRPNVQTHNGAQIPFVLSKPLSDALKSLSQREGVTLFMMLLSAFNTLMYRYTGQDDILVGAPIAGRRQEEVEPMIGFFANTLVLRTDLAGEPSFRELLGRVRQTALEAYAHQDLPFEKLVELQPERSMSHSALFQVMFVLQNAPNEAFELSGVSLTPYPVNSGTAKFDLTLSMEQTEQGLGGYLEYNRDLYDESTIARMLGHFENLLVSVVETPERSIAQLPLLSEAEHEQLVHEWNDTAVEYLTATCVHQMFEAQVVKTPNEVAVVFAGAQLTYCELNQRANQVAHRLQRMGVAPDVLVGLYMERSLEMIVGLLGILKAGGAYVPLDPKYPSERLGLIIDDAQLTVLLTQQHLASELPTTNSEVVCLDAEAADLAKESSENVTSTVTQDNLTYVIYTSGSTGKPKGVLMEHQALCNLLAWQLETTTVPQARTMQFASLNFDVSFQEVFTTLIAGGTLCIVTEEVRRDPVLLLKFLAEEKVERIFLPFVAFQQLAEAAKREDARPTILREIITAGEQLQVTRGIINWLETLPGAVVHNQYGPSETHAVTICTLSGSPANWPALPSIGSAISNVQIYLLDRNMQPVPLGVPGELYVGGVALARGYLNRSELTDERFLPNPFRADGEARLYKTGDLARRLPDGSLEFLGRADQQVKVRGYRVEPGEIESLLTQHEAVREAAVIAREDIKGDKRLVAYLILTTDVSNDTTEALSSTEWRGFLREQVPEYMVPSSFVLLDAFPLTPSGKLDRRALPAPDFDELLHSYVAPRTPVEEAVAGIWAQVLRVERVGREDSFFELGGHSLIATQLISRVCSAFQVEIPLMKLFELPTVAGLSAYIEQVKQIGQTLQAPPIVPIARGEQMGQVTLSFAQERMWFFEQFQSGTATYNMPGAVRLLGRLDVAALERCFNEIVVRHEVLRMTFAVVEGKAVGMMQSDSSLLLETIDLRELPEVEREADAQRLMREEARKPFDLTAGPLVRTTLLQVAEEEHLLLVTMHHIVSDGWSIGVFIREMATMYGALVEGKEAALPPLTIQYADYAQWQKQWLQGEVLEQQLSYWKQKLSGSLPVLQLPTDRTRPAVQTFNGATQTLVLSKELSDTLKELSRREGVTLYMTLLAAFQTLLFRYSRQDDIVVGSPIANRTREEAEQLIGFFVNTLVLRTDLSGEPRFRDLLARVRQVALEAYTHQDLPFEKLVEELQLERNMSYSPLFQVMFALQNTPAVEMELTHLSLTPVTLESGTAKFDLSLSMSDTEQGLIGELEYNTDLYNASTISRMMGHFQTLLEGIIADPELSIARLPMLTDAERHQVVYEWNTTTGDYPTDVCLHQLIERWADQTPNAIAVVYEGQHLTYAELNSRANRLAHYLLRRNIGRDVVVGICMQRSLEQIVALLGVIKTGGAYCPIDTTLPQDRLAFIALDAGVTVLLTQERISGMFHEDVQDKLVCLDGDFAWLEGESEENPNVDATPDDLAYVIYTSGTTGKPKGVLVPHRGVINLMYDYQKRKQLQPGDAGAVWGNFGFDLSAIEIYSALTFGLRLHLFPDDLRADSEAYFKWLSDNEIKCCYIPPFMQRPLIAWLDRGNSLHLQRVQIGIEPIGEKVVAEIARRLPEGVVMLNGYGPTETTIVSVWGTLEPETAQERNMPIGKPAQNMQAYLLDAYMQPVPIGVPGEIHMGGVQIARGYLGRPDLTAEKFIPNPFLDDPKARLYKTGDLGRFLSDGSIDFLGRIDHQVKVRGFRIELGEIETVLYHHPSIRQAVVLAREDGPGEKTLVAYYTLQLEQKVPTTAELRELLKEKLPSYMVPSAIVRLDVMPLSPNKKIDRRALPAPDKTQFARDNEYMAPRTPTEETLATLFGEVLNVESVGMYDSFFELGGHSLLATQLVSRIRSTFAIELPLRSLFDAATIAELSEVVDATKEPFANLENGAVASHLPFAVLDREAHRIVGENRFAYQLSFAQQRLWFLEQLTPGNSAYNIPLAVHLQGQLHLFALEQSLHDVVQRHDALQTTFGVLDGQPVQIIDPSLTLTLHKADLSHLPKTVREKQVAEAMQMETKRAFDLTQGPLMHATLLQLGDEEHVLVLNMHHIISDGWSMSVFLREMTALYEAHLTRQPCTLTPLPVRYADFADWQRKWLADGVLEQQLGYWREKLGGRLPVLHLPTDRPRQKVQTSNGASLHIQVSKQLTEKLKVLSQQEEATLFMTLLAAFKTMLYRYTGQEDIIVGSPIAGRTREEIEGMIGFFVNTLVLRTELGDALPFRELLRRVRDVAFEAYANQDVPFEKLVEELQPERDLSHTPFFQTMFILQNTPMSALQLPGLSLQPLPLDSTTSKFDLTMALTETKQGLAGTLEYNSDLFDETTMQRVAHHFHLLLESIVEQPDQSVGLLPMITEPERQQLVFELNDTARDYDCAPLHHVFEQRVAEVPHLPAVVYQGQSLTYEQLNKRANQLAHHLQKLGITKGTLVGVSMERSIEVVVAMLGVLKAGGAYVMFDPTYPQDRLVFMLKDSDVPVLLIQPHLQDKWVDCNAHVLCLDTGWDALAQESDANPNVAVYPEDIAYVIYTSGTTGKPKGSLAHHRGLINLLDAANKLKPLVAGDRCMVYANLGFDASVYEIFSGLLAGCSLYLVPEDVRYDSETYFQFIQTCQIHSGFIPPTMMKDFAAWLDKKANTLCLHRLFLGIEPIHEQLFGEITRLLPNLTLIYGYGPSEAAVACTFYPLINGSTYKRNTPIGKPYQNVRIYLLDPHMQPVPIGVGGEIYIGGHGVAYGYLNRPELTAERFVRNPFSNDENDRLYKTGDLARFLPDGNLEFLGRTDHQVKLRGYRIELGEIETNLQRHPAIRENVVIVREDVPGEMQIVAYLVADETQTHSTSEMRQFLQQNLPDYMIPSVFMFLDALPLTPNRKVDRRALPKPEQSRPLLEVSYVAPQSELEHQLVAIWQELLRVERVGIHDNFFDLGGHSMLLVQVQRQIKERLSIEIAVVQLFEYPTISTIADYVQSGQEGEQELIQESQQRGESRRELMKQRRQSRTNKRTERTKGEPLDE